MAKLKHKPDREIVQNRWWRQSPVWVASTVTTVLVALMLFYVSPILQPDKPNVPSTANIYSINAGDDIYEYDILDPFDEVSDILEVNDEQSYSSLSYLPLDDDEKFEIYIDDELYTLTEDEYKELIQRLKSNFLG